MTRVALVLTLFTCIGCSTLLAPAGHARSGGYTIEPASGEQIDRELDHVKMRFAREVRITRFRVVQLPESIPADTEGLKAADFDALDPISKVARGFVTEIKVTFENFEAGTYLVEWSVVARDGDVFSGSSNFVVMQ